MAVIMQNQSYLKQLVNGPCPIELCEKEKFSLGHHCSKYWYTKDVDTSTVPRAGVQYSTVKKQNGIPSDQHPISEVSDTVVESVNSQFRLQLNCLPSIPEQEMPMRSNDHQSTPDRVSECETVGPVPLVDNSDHDANARKVVKQPRQSLVPNKISNKRKLKWRETNRFCRKNTAKKSTCSGKEHCFGIQEYCNRKEIKMSNLTLKDRSGKSTDNIHIKKQVCPIKPNGDFDNIKSCDGRHSSQPIIDLGAVKTNIECKVTIPNVEQLLPNRTSHKQQYQRALAQTDKLFNSVPSGIRLIDKVNIWLERYRHNFYLGKSADILSKVSSLYRPVTLVTTAVYNKHMSPVLAKGLSILYTLMTTERCPFTFFFFRRVKSARNESVADVLVAAEKTWHIMKAYQSDRRPHVEYHEGIPIKQTSTRAIS